MTDAALLPAAQPAPADKSDTVRYDAFVSYSHAKDKALAAALQSAVQRLGKAWYQRRSLRLFRDDTALTASPHLWPDIETALGRSRFLILLASPEAAASPWVEKEVATWLARNPADTVLIALTAGDLAWDSEARDFSGGEAAPLPPALRGRFAEEPRWIDLRPYREGASLRDAGFAELAADFAAALHGRPKEDLLSQELRQQRRALRYAFSAVAMLVLLLAVASWQWRVAEDATRQAIRQQKIAEAQRERAEHNLALATDTANSLVFDLAQKFRFSGTPVTVIIDILNRARGLQDQLTAGGETSPDLRYSQAVALGETAYTLLMVGDTTGALSAARKTRDIMQNLVVTAPDNAGWRSQLALSYSRIADALAAQGDVPGALRADRQYLAIAKAVAEKHPNEPYFVLPLAIAQEKVGNLLALKGDMPGALASYREDLRISAELVRNHPKEWKYQRNLAVSHEKIGDLLLETDNGVVALAEYRTELSIIEPLAKAAPNDTDRQRFLALVYDKIGETLMDLHKPDDALVAFRNSLAITRALADGDSDNSEWQRNFAASEERVGTALLAQGKPDDALAAFEEQQAIAKALSEKHPKNLGWQLTLALSDQHIGKVLVVQHNLAAALLAFRSQLTIIQHLVQKQPGSDRWQLELTDADKNVGDVLLEQGDLPAALAAYRDGLAVATKIAARQPIAERLTRLGELNDQVALVLERQGDGPGALTAYRESVAIARRLTSTEPNQPQWQLDLAFSLVRFAKAGGDFKASLTEALLILKRLDAEAKLTADQKSWIPMIEAALAKV